jgi:hypothetical protein
MHFMIAKDFIPKMGIKVFAIMRKAPRKRSQSRQPGPGTGPPARAAGKPAGYDWQRLSLFLPCLVIITGSRR